MDSLRSEVQELIELKLNEHQRKIQRLSDVIVKQNQKIRRQQREIDLLRTENNQAKDGIRRQRDELNLLRDDVNRRLSSRESTDFVGFSAYTTDDQDPDVGDIIRLPNVHLNAGGGYNTGTSIFTCPTTGFYYIYFNMFLWMEDEGSSSRDDCRIGIRVDGTIMVTVRSVFTFHSFARQYKY